MYKRFASYGRLLKYCVGINGKYVNRTAEHSKYVLLENVHTSTRKWSRNTKSNKYQLKMQTDHRQLIIICINTYNYSSAY